MLLYLITVMLTLINWFKWFLTGFFTVKFLFFVFFVIKGSSNL